jgi:hypothetical protein
VEQTFHLHRKFIVTEFTQRNPSERAELILRQGCFGCIEKPRKALPRQVGYVSRPHHFP